MAGAYCQYCDKRCFVDRKIPGNAQEGIAPRWLHMATCGKGAEHDRRMTGYDYTTAINPFAREEQ